MPLRGTLSCAFGAALLQGPALLSCNIGEPYPPLTRSPFPMRGKAKKWRLRRNFKIVFSPYRHLERSREILLAERETTNVRQYVSRRFLKNAWVLFSAVQWRSRAPLRMTMRAALVSHSSFSVLLICASARHSILRLWRGPSSRACSAVMQYRRTLSTADAVPLPHTGKAKRQRLRRNFEIAFFPYHQPSFSTSIPCRTSCFSSFLIWKKR